MAAGWDGEWLEACSQSTGFHWKPILDEAANALDQASKGMTQQAPEPLMAGRTTFIVTHRLNILGPVNHAIFGCMEGRWAFLGGCLVWQIGSEIRTKYG
jgi:hypothetical protein